ncbi:ABC transporter ATP-binding protein [Devosia sp. YIM 151766]|uniref:ABC transporter ATP-binding protein n=1 Tax=Devosia sp. YIM 151766 TaxID=3017325 RepID=UPI00255C8C28|nr:ABC transporter ATP-binding protein [Devosia sp. YIM 151766]WIY53560.1 ABC transporter ATP-binding protein [Devosia sp. YIM 151766]
MAQIEIENVSKMFSRPGSGDFHALSDVSLTVERGEVVAIIGSSGCGKTTLLNVVAGLLSPSGGSISVEGERVRGPGRDRGVVFQQDALFMWRSVVRNVEYGLELQGMSSDERRRTAMEWLEVVGLSRFADFWPKELSGGMKKRCQIAVVLANDPDVLLMDEPYGALDYTTKCELQSELLRILDERPKTVFFVTHDIEEAAFLADRVIVMDKGRITASIPIAFQRPRTEALRLDEEFARVRRQLADAIDQPNAKSVR